MTPYVVYSRRHQHNLSSVQQWEHLFASGAVVTVLQFRNGRSSVPHYICLQWVSGVGCVVMDPLEVSRGTGCGSGSEDCQCRWLHNN